MLLYAAGVGSPVFGAALLFVFALARGWPLILTGAFTSVLKDLRPLARFRPYSEIAAAVLMIVVGAIFVAQRFIF